MNAPGYFKTPAGAEFHQMVDEAKKFGLRPADVARRMELSKAQISKYLSGTSDPTPSRLTAMRNILQELKGVKYPDGSPEKVAGMDPVEVDDASQMLRDIHEVAPGDFQIVHQVIKTYHSNSKRKPKISSTKSAAAEGVKLAEALERQYDSTHASPGQPAPGSSPPLPSYRKTKKRPSSNNPH